MLAEASQSIPVATGAPSGRFTKLFADRYPSDNIRMNNVLPVA